MRFNRTTKVSSEIRSNTKESSSEFCQKGWANRAETHMCIHLTILMLPLNNKNYVLQIYNYNSGLGTGTCDMWLG